MQKRWLVLSLIAIGMCLAFISNGIGEDVEDLCIPMGEIMLYAPKGVDVQREPVAFPHARHFTYTCQTCHHEWQADGLVDSCMTSGCHDLIETPKISEEAGVDLDEAIGYFKKAFHDRCIGCHKTIARENAALEKQAAAGKQVQIRATGPTGCVGCHPRE